MSEARSRLGEVARVFLRLGFTAFGGPAVHAAMMEDEVVARRRWLDRQHFLDLLGAVNFIPGPNSTELAIHLGLIRAGWKGLIVAGACFVVPAMLIILPLGWLYVTYGALPAVAGPIAGIRAAAIAIVAHAMARFARTGVKDRFTGAVAVVTLTLGGLMTIERFRVPQGELVLLALAAVAGVGWYGGKKRRSDEATERRREGRASDEATERRSDEGGAMMPVAVVAAAGSAGAGVSTKLLAMALFFLKVGATLFGSGYVLVSYLRGGLVDDHGWMTPQELADAVAVGQVTPGPLLTTATFVGYLLGHRWSGGSAGVAAIGGALATAAIFLPSFVLVAMLGRIWPRLRGASWARGALDGMNAAVVALIAVVAFTLARDALTGPWAYAIAAAALVVLIAWNVNATWVIVGAGILGWAVLEV